MRFRPFLAALWVCLFSWPALATVVGNYPDFQQQYSVFGDREVTGNTLMVHYSVVNTALDDDGSSGSISGIPAGATIDAAFLFWSGTATEDGTDENVSFTLPNGTNIDLGVNSLQPGEPNEALANSECTERTKRWQRRIRGNLLTADLTSFYCRRDVTHLLRSLSPNFNGSYHVSGVDALAGWPDTVQVPGFAEDNECIIDTFNANRIPAAQQIACQAMYAGWSMVTIWSHPDARIRRNITLYDGFVLMDEDQSSGLINFDIDGFSVAEDAEGEFSFFGLEGDEQLGSSQANQPVPLFCDVCDDFIEMTVGGRAPVQLRNAWNPIGNLWNGSIQGAGGGGAAPGVDLDTYDIGQSGLRILQENDQSADLRAGSGDGRPGGPTGGGELVFLGWSALSLDTYAPDLNNPQTRKSVFPAEAGPGQRLIYRIEIVNDGSADATDVVVRDLVPTGTSYVAGSTETDCGANASDVGGTTRLETGLTITTLPFQPPGRARCAITFQVQVNDDVRPGDRIRNTASISSAEQAEFSTNTAETRILGPTLGTPLKTVRNPGDGIYQPGQTIEYTIEVVNDGQAGASGITVTDRLPAGLTFLFANPPQSSFDAGTQTVVWSNVRVDGNDSTNLVIYARINELPGGTIITNQAQLTADFLGAPSLTDDPLAPGPLDGTSFVVVNGPDFTTSTKTASVVGGGAVVPGATLQWVIELINAGNQAGNVDLRDRIPGAGLGTCSVQGLGPGLVAECPGILPGQDELTVTGSVPAGQTRTVTFTTTLAEVPDGTVLRNVAYLERDGQEDLAITANALVAARGGLLAGTWEANDLDGAPLGSEDLVDLTLNLENVGGAIAQGIGVNLPIDANLEVVSVGAGGQIQGGQVIWQGLGDLGPGGDVSVSLQVRVRPGRLPGTQITLVASLSGNNIPGTESEPLELVVDAEGILAMTKSVEDLNGGDFRPGDFIRYSLEIVNEGEVSVRDLVLTDTIPEGLINPNATGNGQFADGVITWNGESNPAFTTLSPGQTISLQIVARLSSPMEDGREISNQARLISRDAPAEVSDDPSTDLADDPTLFEVESETSLLVEKTDEALDGGNYAPGSQVQYSISVRAGGSQRAQGLTVTDTVPDSLSIVAAGSNGVVDGRTVTWTQAEVPSLAAMSPGDEVQLSLIVAIDPRAINGDRVPNQARVAGVTVPVPVLSNDPDTAQADDPTEFIVGGSPELTFTKQVAEAVSDNAFRIGETVRYTLTLNNVGNVDATQVEISDSLSELLTDVEVLGDWATVRDGLLEGTIGRIEHGRSLEFAFTAVIVPAADGTEVSNVALVRPLGASQAQPSDDPSLPGDADPTVFLIVAEEGVQVVKTAFDADGEALPPGSSVLPDQAIIYNLALTNTGQVEAQNISLVDNVPLELRDATPEPGSGGLVDGRTLSWNVADLSAGETVNLRFSARVAPVLEEGTSISNQASALLDNEPYLSDDGDPENGDDNPTVLVVGRAPQPDPVVTKTVEPSEAQRGDRVTWTVVVENQGDGPLQSALLEDVIDSALEVDSVEGGVHAGGRTSTSLTLAPGERHEMVIVTRILNSAGVTVSNSATLRFADQERVSDDPAEPGANDPTVVTIQGAPFDLWLEKAVTDDNGGNVEAGDTLTYELQVNNRGTEEVPELSLSDVLDPRLQLVAGSLSFDGGQLSADAEGQLFSADGTVLQGPLAVGGLWTLAFKVVVDPEAQAGDQIPNQARLAVLGAANTERFSDDPRLPGGPQATVVEVGRSGSLQILKTVSPTEAVRGDEVTWTLELLSTLNGAAVLSVEDLIPEGVDYLPGTMNLEGQALTDEVDADPAEFSDGSIRLRASLDGSERRLVFSFRSRVTSMGGTVANQATFDLDGVTGQSDGDPNTAEAEPTLLTVGLAPVDLTTSEKRAVDVNGNRVEPGDRIRYEIKLTNTGGQDALVAPEQLIDQLPAGTSFVDGSGDPEGWLRHQDGAVTNVDLITVPAGETVTVRFEVELASDLANGTPVSNLAVVFSGGSPVEVGPAELVVGERPPGASVQGRVSSRLTSLEGWTVRVRELTEPFSEVEAQTDEQGRYRIDGIKSAAVLLQVLNSQGTTFLERPLDGLVDGDQRTEDCLVDPSGVLYDSVTGRPVAGATVVLLYDISGSPVIDEDLLEGQQNQVTGADGFYRFDLTDPRLEYRLSVTPPNGFLSFPSTERLPEGGSPSRPFGSYSHMSAPEAVRFPPHPEIPGRLVVASSVPYDDKEIEGGDRPDGCEGPGNCRWDDGDLPLDPVPYFLRFLIEGPDDAVFNNHVPLDPISKSIKLSRRPDKRRASTGDLITFTVEVSNESFTVIDTDLDGGPRLLDMLPPSLAPLGGEALTIYDVSGQARRQSAPVSKLSGSVRELTDWRLAPGERLVWIYRTTVLPGAPLGPMRSTNHLLTRHSSVPLADPAQADVELVPDAFLEESNLLGRAYCDVNGNNRFDPRELGVPGLRIYGDHGFYVETDGFGRYHFSRLRPGIHRVKIDERSLPAGVSVADPGRSFELTPGLPVAIDFALKCDLMLSGPEELARNPMAAVRRAPPPPMDIPELELVADPETGVILVSERLIDVPQVFAGVFGPSEEVDMGRMSGPNLGYHENSLHLYARAVGSLPMGRWTWRLQTVGGRTVWEKAGDGAPPAKLVVELPQGLKRNQSYYAWLDVDVVGGDRASSRLIPVGLGTGMKKPRKRRPSVLDESNGRLFVDDGATPTPRFRGWFGDRLSRLKGDEELVAEVQVHGASGKGSVKSTVFTDRRGQTIRGMLLAGGIDPRRFRIRSMGAKRKLVPNRTKAMRRKNNRVEIRFTRVISAAEPIELGMEVPPQLLMNSQELDRSEDGKFKVKLALGIGDRVVLDMITARGGRIRVTRRRHLDGLEVLPQRARGLDGLEVAGQLRGLDRKLKVAGQDLDLDLLSVRIRPLVRAVKLNAEGTGLEPIKKADGSIMCPGVCVGVTTDFAPETWELRIRQASDVGFDRGLEEAPVIHTLKGVGPLPKVLPWDGRGGAEIFILREGIYGLRLILRGKAGLTAISAPSFFRVYRPEGDFRVLLPDPFGKPKRERRRRGRSRRAKSQSKGKLGTLQLSPDARRDLDRFIALSKVLRGDIGVYAHTDLTVRATQADGLTRSMAERIRTELVKGGIEAGRVMIYPKGNQDRIIPKARKPEEHAKNRRVELRLSAEQILPLPELPMGVAVARAPGGDLVADDDGMVAGRLLPSKNGKIVLRLEDGSGRSAVYPLRTEKGPESAVGPMHPVVPILEGSAEDMLDADVASLVVSLPPAGSVHRHTSLGVFGRSLPGVKVTVNGTAATVHPLTGAFGIVIPVKPGEQTIEVVAEDQAGNRGRLSRKVMVEPHGWFLMGLADLAYGTPAVPMYGARGDRTLDMGGFGRLNARAMAWYKRSWSFPKGSTFRRVDLSTYVDSDRWGFLEFERLADDGRQAREFGDDAKEVQEVKAAGPLYLDLKADDSYVKVANFKTKQPGRKLLRYHRSFYGFDTLFSKTTGPKKEARNIAAGLYASSTAQGLRAASNLFAGTGGSFYRLRHGDLLSGSERVRLVVRDQMSGLALVERQLVRGRDYRVDAVEGLLVLNEPLPTTAGLGFASNLGVSTGDLAGHPVFVEVDYTYRGAANYGSLAAGGRVDGGSKKIGLKGGLSYHFEGREDGRSAFQAVGVFADWKHKKGHGLSTEFAYSRALDGEHYASADGGSSFHGLGSALNPEPVSSHGVVYPNPEAPRVGLAWRLEGHTNLGLQIGREKKEDLSLRAYLRQTTPGYYGGGTPLDQGQSRWGLRTRYKVNKTDAALINFAGSYSLVAEPGQNDPLLLSNPVVREYRRLHREAVVLRYQRKKKLWEAGGEYAFGYTSDSWTYAGLGEDPGNEWAKVFSHVIGGDGLYHINKRWSAGGAQRIVLSGDHLRFNSDAANEEDIWWRFSTTGRLRYKLAKHFSLEAEEELRWNGDNQTRLGIVRRPAKGIEHFVQERFSQQGGGFFNSTVVGAREQVTKHESNRAELRVDHSVGDPKASAVIATRRRYRPLAGLDVNLAYERTQVLSGGAALSLASPVTGTGQASDLLGRPAGASDVIGQPTSPEAGTRLLQSGMNGWGLGPITGSRDALAVSAAYQRKNRIHLKARSELRLDVPSARLNGSAIAGTTEPHLQDRLTHFNELSGRLKISPDLAVLGRFALSVVRNLNDGSREQHSEELSLGLAFRPQYTDRYRGLLRLTRRADKSLGGWWSEQNLLSLEPIFETPFFVQISDKLAIKQATQNDDLLGLTRSTTGLFVQRFDFHLTRLIRSKRSFPMPGDIDVMLEYRALGNVEVDAVSHGLALGLAYLPTRHVRIGMGYSFTKVPDSLAPDARPDGSGFFLRVTGNY